MIGLTIDQDTSNLERLEAISRRWPGFISDTILPRLMPLAERRVTQTLRREPGPVKYPIRWTSEKQRAYYFAVIAPRDAEGRVMAYQRTGRIAAGWEVLTNERRNSAEIHVINTASASRYVYGDEAGNHQQWFHQDTGWPSFQVVFADLSHEMNQRLERVIDDAWLELWR